MYFYIFESVKRKFTIILKVRIIWGAKIGPKRGKKVKSVIEASYRYINIYLLASAKSRFFHHFWSPPLLDAKITSVNPVKIQLLDCAARAIFRTRCKANVSAVEISPIMRFWGYRLAARKFWLNTFAAP